LLTDVFCELLGFVAKKANIEYSISRKTNGIWLFLLKEKQVQ
jgi:hypothetical protein